MEENKSSVSGRIFELILVCVFVLILVVVIAGAVVLIINPSNLSFHDYLSDISLLTVGLIGALAAAILKLRTVTKNGEPAAQVEIDVEGLQLKPPETPSEPL
jgi:uncharacterized membrane protein YbhN (UPF0104 family)